MQSQFRVNVNNMLLLPGTMVQVSDIHRDYLTGQAKVKAAIPNGTLYAMYYSSRRVPVYIHNVEITGIIPELTNSDYEYSQYYL